MNEIIGVIGVGYVGLPLIEELSTKSIIIAYDIDNKKIEHLKKVNINNNITFTSNEVNLRKCNIIIVAVPTPIDKKNNPDLNCIIEACKTIGKNIKNKALIIFESTYTPGTTNDICIPIIEKESGKKYNKDFYVGYSPERINPGDKIHTLNNITKIVSADDKETLNKVVETYNLIENINLITVNSIKVAELSKMIENTQRDINIAFINEVSILCHELNINTKEVIDAASTKWNFYKVFPGLVGGDCIGVDPYYLINLANRHNINLDIVKCSRETNESMSNYIVENLISLLPQNCNFNKISVGILGYAYKANSDNISNTKIKNIIEKLKCMGFIVNVTDYMIQNNKAILNLSETVKNLNVLIIAVEHDKYKSYCKQDIINYFKKDSQVKIIMDLKSLYCNYEFPNEIKYWSL